ncbi:MAG: SDR family oxidoreductase [Parachlamydiaceae bacterium]
MTEILITGASRGIGLSLSQHLLANQHRVLGISRTPPPIHDQNFAYQQADFSKLSKDIHFFDHLVKKYPYINTLICNAGIGRFAHLEEFSYPQMKEIFEINFLAHAYLVRAYLPLFKKRASGKIVFIGSEAALKGQKKGALYCASKFALRGFAQALREECSSQGIAISIVNPGMIANSFYDNLYFRPGSESSEHLTSEDVVQAILYLLHARSGCVVDEINLSPQKKKISFS